MPLFSGVLGAAGVVRGEMSFPAFLKPPVLVKFVTKEGWECLRLFHTFFFCNDPCFLFGKALSFWEIRNAERCKIIYREILILKLSRID